MLRKFDKTEDNTLLSWRNLQGLGLKCIVALNAKKTQMTDQIHIGQTFFN